MNKNTYTLVGKFECCGITMVTVIIKGKPVCVMTEKMYESVNILGISTKFIYPDMEHVSRDIIGKYTK